MFELMDAYSQSAVIKVIGVGGGGGNAVAHMVTTGIDGVDFMCVNTDAQALKHSKVKTAPERPLAKLRCGSAKLRLAPKPGRGRVSTYETAPSSCRSDWRVILSDRISQRAIDRKRHGTPAASQSGEIAQPDNNP